ncbi:MAG: hypothetical protein Q7T73_10915 [Beijerinckiaceae bacterium]|nr:hypothetical protein [Beijerinckiaceae bacterium]
MAISAHSLGAAARFMGAVVFMQAFPMQAGAEPAVIMAGLAAPGARPTIATPLLQAQVRQDFVLVNKTGYDISAVYVSPAKTDDWEDDVLGEDELEDGDETLIRFGRREKSCMWDLKVVYSEDDSSAYWKGIDLCKVSTITIRYNRSTDTTSATFD